MPSVVKNEVCGCRSLCLCHVWVRSLISTSSVVRSPWQRVYRNFRRPCTRDYSSTLVCRLREVGYHYPCNLTLYGLSCRRNLFTVLYPGTVLRKRPGNEPHHEGIRTLIRWLGVPVVMWVNPSPVRDWESHSCAGLGYQFDLVCQRWKYCVIVRETYQRWKKTVVCCSWIWSNAEIRDNLRFGLEFGEIGIW